ncbi:PAS domain S-box protein [Methanosarcina sp. KYL-1]|nr:MASE3 domain-containing protein [Methanosarcina sp. KYL-1]MCQ1534802.1 PAS domain S-box protein [Methanosarcina sp. KYL-1]
MHILDSGIKKTVITPGQATLWVVVVGVLYIISLNNYLLFHCLVELFSVLIAYVVFLIVWKSKGFVENRYLLFIGIAYLFIGILDFLRTLSYEGMGVFPEFDGNLPAQLWIAARYLESISLFVAPLLLVYPFERDFKENFAQRKSEPVENARLARKVLFVYAGVSGACLLSIFFLRNFPDCYIEGSGPTPFKIVSEYLISFVFFCSLFLLYRKRYRFENHVFRVLAASIGVTILAELALIYYTNTDGFFNFIGHCLKLLSFYLIYKAIIETGFEEPCNLLFRELKQSEEAFRQEAIFLRDSQGRIYRMLGVKQDMDAEYGPEAEDLPKNDDGYRSFMQNFQGIGFQFDRNFAPVFMHGAVEEITGYSKNDFLSGNVKWDGLVAEEDLPLILAKREKSKSSPELSTELEYRIRRKDGEIRWVREILQYLAESPEAPRRFQGSIYDITERKRAEEALEKIDQVRTKEIHHRIKNNLQVISSLLSLQAETFGAEDVLEAFRESQNRVISMALIHEELYKGGEIDTLDFAAYLRKLTAGLISSYTVENKDISLKLDLEQVYLGMDTAIPLGIIVNELVSNALKHAFAAVQAGEIRISLSRAENSAPAPGTSGTCRDPGHENGLQYTLVVADNGKGIPEEIDITSTESLGLQLVNILVEQIDGCIELKRNTGTEFLISFSDISK